MNAQPLEPYTFILDTGAWLNLVSKAILKKEWLSNIKKQHLPCLRTPRKKHISVDGTTSFLIRIGHFSGIVWFMLVENSAVSILFGTCSSTGIFEEFCPAKEKPCNSTPRCYIYCPATTLRQHSTMEVNKTGKRHLQPAATIRIERKTVIPPDTSIASQLARRVPDCSSSHPDHLAGTAQCFTSHLE